MHDPSRFSVILSPGFILFLLSFASYAPASAQAVSTPSPQTTYLYFHRSSGHVTALFFLPFSPLQHGNQAVMPRGTVLEAAIDSDALLPRAVIEAAQPKPAETHHGPASVTFYYPNFEDGSAVNVWCGEVKVGHLKRGGKFTLTLPPGKYRLRTWNSKKSPTTVLDAENGGEEYVRVIMPIQRTGVGGEVEHLALVPHDVGEAQAAEAIPAKSHDVVDIAKLDVTQLHSDPQMKRKK